MSFYNDFKAVAGLNSADEDAVPVVTVEVEQVTAEKDEEIAEAVVEQALAEVETIGTQLDVVEEKLEDALEDIAAAESYLNGEKAFDREGFMMAYSRAARSLNRFGLADAVELEGQESYAEHQSAELNARAGLNSLKETAGKIATGIKDFFIKLYNGIKNIFIGIFNGFKATANRATAIKAELGKKTDENLKDQIKLGTWNAFVGMKDGKFDYSAEELSKKLTTTYDALYTALRNGDATGITNTVVSNLEAYSAIGDNKTKKGNTDNNDRVESQYIGLTLTMVVPKSDAKDQVVALRNTKFGFSVNKEQKNVELTGSVKRTANVKLLSGICDKVAEAARKAQNNKFDAKQLEVLRDAAIGKIEAYASKDTKEDDKKAIEIIKAGNRSGMLVMSGITKLVGASLKAHLEAVKAHY